MVQVETLLISHILCAFIFGIVTIFDEFIIHTAIIRVYFLVKHRWIKKFKFTSKSFCRLHINMISVDNYGITDETPTRKLMAAQCTHNTSYLVYCLFHRSRAHDYLSCIKIYGFTFHEGHSLKANEKYKCSLVHNSGPTRHKNMSLHFILMVSQYL